MPSGHFSKSDHSFSYERSRHTTLHPVTEILPAGAHTDVADMPVASTHRPQRMACSGQSYYDDALILSRAHDQAESFVEPEVPIKSKRTSLLTQALQKQAQPKSSSSNFRSTYRRQSSVDPMKRHTRSHPMQMIQPTTASFAPPSRVHQGMHMILEGWLKITTVQRGTRMPPQGKDLEALLTITNATPAYIHTWFVRRLNKQADSLDFDLHSFSRWNSAHDYAGPPQATTDTDQHDVQDVEKLIIDRKARSCTTKQPYPLHTKPFSCGKCGAGAKDFTEWRRHRESVFPLKFFRCRMCNKIETRHVPDHTIKVHQLEPSVASYQILYDPPWTGSCEYCGEGFQGLRTNTWKLMQEHVWKQHIRNHPVTTPRCNLPKVANIKDSDKDGDGPEDKPHRASQGSQSFDSSNTRHSSGVHGSFYGPSQRPISYTSGNNERSYARWDDSVSSDDTYISDSSDDEEPFRGRTLQRRASPSDAPLTGLFDGLDSLTAHPDISMRGIGAPEHVVGSDQSSFASGAGNMDIDDIVEDCTNEADFREDYGDDHMFLGDNSDDRTSRQLGTEASRSQNLMLCRSLKHRASVDDLRLLDWHQTAKRSGAYSSLSKHQCYLDPTHPEGLDKVMSLPEYEIAESQTWPSCPVISPLQASLTEKQREYMASNANFIVHLGKGVAFYHTPSDSVPKVHQVVLKNQGLLPFPSSTITTVQECNERQRLS